MASALALLVLVFACLRRAHDAWRFEALDVGQGDALVLTLGPSTWVIDAGDARPVDAGARVLVPHLRRQGVRRLRGLVLSHPHRDHCGGALSLLESIPADTLYVARASQADSLYWMLRRTFEEMPVRELARGDTLLLAPEYRAAVLWPGPTDVLGSGANGTSIVLHAQGGGHAEIVTMGDLEADGEEALLRSWKPRSAGTVLRILKAGHHGSTTSSTPAFLARVDADLALISVGARNRYGHPGEETLAAFAARGCPVLRTDRGGAVRLVRRGDALWIERPGTAGGAARLVDASRGAP
jgi:competence protein ComEC